MTAPELVPKKGQGDVEDAGSRRTDLERSHPPAPRRTVRRWEFGFFIRKIVNGWLAYYKKFPPGSRSEVQAATHQAVSAESPESGGQEPLVSGPVQPLSGHARGGDDSGPVGSTRVEAGFFLSSTTDTTDEDTNGT